MSEKRLVVDENYNIVDTVTDKWLDDTQVFDLTNKLAKENNELKSKIKDLKFENEKKYRTIMQLEQMLQDVER